MSRTISRASSLINTFYLFAFLVLCIVHCPPGLMAVSSLRLLSLAFALKLSPFLNICLFLLLNTRSHFNISNCISYNLNQHWKHNSGLNNNTSLNQIRWNYVNFYIRSNSFFNWSYKPKITIFVTFLRARVCVRARACVYMHIYVRIYTQTRARTHTHSFMVSAWRELMGTWERMEALMPQCDFLLLAMTLGIRNVPSIHIPAFQAYTFWLGFSMSTLLMDTWNIHHFLFFMQLSEGGNFFSPLIRILVFLHTPNYTYAVLRKSETSRISWAFTIWPA